jgi:3-hydroxyacyl-CoA dehydrogenase/enoyl-CoA hydratase/carnithine racemase
MTQGTRLISFAIENSIAILGVDAPDSKVNLLSRAFCLDLDKILESIKSADDIKAIVITSKKDDFIVGADIKELESLTTAELAERQSQQAQQLMSKIAAFPKPIVAAIQGSCLGGGLELSLACQGRVASDEKRTQLGLPEVNLGILPAAGGTQRLPLLVGLPVALDMLLTGRTLSASKAKKVGLVDQVVPRFLLVEAAKTLAFRLAKNPVSFIHRAKTRLKNLALLPIALPKAKRAVQDKTQGNFPAPLALLEVVQSGIVFGIKHGLIEEAKQFASLVMGATSKNLMRLFFLSTARKKAPTPHHLGETSTLGVLGAGFMGTSIGLLSLRKGMRVLIYDNHKSALSKSESGVLRELGDWQKKGRLEPFDVKRLESKISFEDSLDAFAACDVIIEAVFEDLNVKKSLLRHLEPVLQPNTVFASNTSALPIEKIAEGAAHPNQIVGMHYFSPVDKMPLLEIVKAPATGPRTLQIAQEIGALQGKTMIVVNDAPGFYTSRILAPYLDEAVRLVASGIEPHQLDKALQKFGFPVGPIQLLDEVGLDIALHVEIDMSTYSPRFKDTFLSGLADQLLKAGNFGRKTGKGFYIYDDQTSHKKRTIYQPTLDLIRQHAPKEGRAVEGDIAAQCLLRMVNEAVMCLQEGILSNADDGDVGAILGLGFPAHLGGPFRYIDQVGAQKIYEQLKAMSETLGDRFKPAELLRERANTGALFT